MSYIVRTNPAGEKHCWQERDTIPGDHTAIRTTTSREAMFMDSTMDWPGELPEHLGNGLKVDMQRTNAVERPTFPQHTHRA